MFSAVLSAFLFAASATFSQRAARIFGSLEANFFRLCGACTILGLVTWHFLPRSIHQDVFWWFFLSGAVGFGIGDVALFLAYPRLGSRLALLIHFCGSTIMGALGDYALMRKSVGTLEALAASIILTGLAVTMLAKRSGTRHGSRFAGVCFALLSAVGMGMGTALSHFAIEKNLALNLTSHGISQAWQRSTAGVLVAGIVLLLVRFALRNALPEGRQRLEKPRSGCTSAFWMTGTMILGPVLGVSCYQWAIMETGSSAIVCAVAATSTLIIMPLARWLEKDRPSRQQIAGTLLAVAGVAWLCWLRK